jgi:hypothetical protein
MFLKAKNILVLKYTATHARYIAPRTLVLEQVTVLFFKIVNNWSIINDFLEHSCKIK